MGENIKTPFKPLKTRYFCIFIFLGWGTYPKQENVKNIVLNKKVYSNQKIVIFKSSRRNKTDL